MKPLARWKTFFEPISIGMIIFGIFSLCQPFTFFLYHNSFAFLGIGAALYTFFSHIPSLQDLIDWENIQKNEEA